MPLRHLVLVVLSAPTKLHELTGRPALWDTVKPFIAPLGAKQVCSLWGPLPLRHLVLVVMSAPTKLRELTARPTLQDNVKLFIAPTGTKQVVSLYQPTPSKLFPFLLILLNRDRSFADIRRFLFSFKVSHLDPDALSRNKGAPFPAAT
ncbi:hypothetical protein NDU88_010979 [Pleurodeles waltl]|uniref:Uncharacterized protein n=1 Tax=Pleurodeles waltl TaxID=8319 RepID=A0AAV7RZR9_PLEWA|nr:hypothetical protein NDU88_010979 [Pleurodeles waltl]